MADVRWSSDSFRSDFYIYEHFDGTVTLHLAGARKVPAEGKPWPEAPAFPINGNDAAIEQWMAQHQEFDRALDEMGHEPIDHPEAGATIKTSSYIEMIAECERLISEGFIAPDWMLDALRDSAKDTQ